MEQLNFNLNPKKKISHKQLISIFDCTEEGRIRISHKNNCLILIINESWDKKNTIFKFQALGEVGDQSLTYSYNNNLYKSNENNTTLFLFSCFENEYTYLNRVFLIGQEKVKENDRELYYFKLIRAGVTKNITEFLRDQGENYLYYSDVLDSGTKTLFYGSAFKIMKLMKLHNIDTLVSVKGWFLTKEGYYFNNNSSIQLGKVEDNQKNTVFENQNKFLNPFYYNSLVYENKKEKLKNYVPGNKGFKLLYLLFKDDEDKEIEVFFMNEKISNKISESPFTSLLIGSNGMGKSRILSKTQKIFYELYRLSDAKKIESYMIRTNYKIHYKIGQDTIKIDSMGQKKVFLLNEEKVSFSSDLLPSKLLAVSALLNDKFTFNKNKDMVHNGYEYLGMKSSSNAAMTGTLENSVVESLLLILLQNNYAEDLKFITEFLNVKPIIRIKFDSFRLKTIFDSETLEEAKNSNYHIRFSEQDWYDIFNFSKLKKSRLFYIEGSSFYVSLDFLKVDSLDELYEYLRIINLLIEKKVIIYEDIELKKENYFPLKMASSGEFYFFNTMIRILSRIEHNSIILIDEPEVSLHPNWQYKYISGLNSIFQRYNSCHFILATHSHFMVSDIIPGSSSIISIKRDENMIIKTYLHEEETFGWSPDDILYNIFSMKTIRNYYLENDLRDLLLMVSESSKDINSMKKYVKKLESLTLKEEDPLLRIITRIKEYIQNVESQK